MDHARSTYDRYQAARRVLGFDHEDNPGIAWHVWEKCEPDAQESMALQLERPATEHKALIAGRGEAFGSF